MKDHSDESKLSCLCVCLRMLVSMSQVVKTTYVRARACINTVGRDDIPTFPVAVQGRPQCVCVLGFGLRWKRISQGGVSASLSPCLPPGAEQVGRMQQS